MRTALVSRRSFVKAAGSLFLAGLAPEKLFALERSDAVYAAAFVDPAGRFGLATLAEDGTIIDRSPLPNRAHGLAFDRNYNRVVAFARRPGTFAAIFDLNGRSAPVVIVSPRGAAFLWPRHVFARRAGALCQRERFRQRPRRHRHL